MNNSLIEEPSLSRYYVERTSYYVIPFLITFGILGNSLSAYVILHTKLRKLSSSYYLLALSSNDSVMLLTIGIHWLCENDIDLYNRPILCQVITYVSDLCASMSVWLIVVFTVERFVVVKYPLRSKFLCTVRRAKLIIVILFMAMLILYSPLLFIAGLELNKDANRPLCSPKSEWQRMALIFNSFDFIFTCILPVPIISLLNAIICRKVWKFSNLRRKMTEDFHMDNLRGPARVLNQVKTKADKTSYKMTKMLLVVSTVCLCMILPSFVMRFIMHLSTLGLVVITDIKTCITIQLYMQFLYYLTFGINFALYCISGQNFRKAVSATFCKWRFQRNSGLTGTGGTATGTGHGNGDPNKSTHLLT